MEAEPPTDPGCPEDPQAGADPGETAEEVLVSREVLGPQLWAWGTRVPSHHPSRRTAPASSSRRT